MSSERRLFEHLINEQKKKSFWSEDTPRKPEGYETLITPLETEAIKKLCDSFDTFINIHNRSLVNNIDDLAKATPYARVQYQLLTMMTDDLHNAMLPIRSIHSASKEVIDNFAKGEELSVEAFLKKLEHMALTNKLENLLKVIR